MEIKELQKKADEDIDKIDKKVNVEHNLENTILHLIEEVGELIAEIGKVKYRNQNIDMENLKDEIADVILFLCKIANIYNINIQDAINKKFEKLEKRHS
jgi:NTP pyrophosphatase (non-canonical NTP hydrolase)